MYVAFGGRLYWYSKRMMGLEPTTFYMATGPLIRTMLATDHMVELNLGRA